MALSNELTSEIAVAILATKHNPQELKALRDILLQVHDELQRMSREARDHRQTKNTDRAKAIGRSC